MNKHKTKRKAMKTDKKDAVDLSSVNTVKKNGSSLVKVKNYFKKQDGPRRDAEGKFTSGSGGLKKLQAINWRRAAPLIIAVALVGGIFVWKSYAAGSREQVTTWYRTCLNREPDAGGLTYWSHRLDSGEATWSVARAFMNAARVTTCSYPNTPRTSTTNATQFRFDAYERARYPDIEQKYKDAVIALWKNAMERFWQAYDARNGQLGSSVSFPNLANSCAHEIPDVRAGRRSYSNYVSGVVPGNCFSLVGLNNPQIDTYAVQVARGVMTLDAATQQFMTGPTALTQGCDRNANDFTDCYTRNQRNILLGQQTDNPNSSRNTQTRNTTPDTQVTPGTSSNTRTNTTTTTNQSNNQNTNNQGNSLFQKLFNKIFNK